MADEQKTEIENTESLETKQEEPQEKLLTQEEFDNAFKNRLARERRKLEKKYFIYLFFNRKKIVSFCNQH